MSKVTSIRGTPRGAGMPSSSKRESIWLRSASSRSPWKTWISTLRWFSEAVL